MLSSIIQNDRYPLSRIVALKEILEMLRPQPEAPGALSRNGITSRRAKADTHGDEVSGATLHQVPLPSTPVAVSGGKDIMPGRLLRP